MPHEPSVPYGYCHCRCGRKTNLIIHSSPTRGLIKGEPKKFINGHQRKVRPSPEEAVPFKIEDVYCRLIPISQRHWAIVDEADYLWLMQWKWSLGYGRHTFYAVRHERKEGIITCFAMHTEIAGLKDGLQRDHINGNGLDNRRKNLRPASISQQHMNAKLYENNTSGHKGIDWDKRNKAWKVRITVGRKNIWLGRHKLLNKAVEVRQEAERKYFGEWARVNPLKLS